MKTRKGSAPKPLGGAKKKGKASRKDPIFLDSDSKKRRKINDDAGDFIDSGESDEELVGDLDWGNGQAASEEEEDEFAKETADEKRKRLALAHLDKLRDVSRKAKEDEGDLDDYENEANNEGNRDYFVANLLQQKQLEDSGRLRRSIASSVRKPEPSDQFRVLLKHRQSVTAVTLSEDDLKGFSASKDGTIMHWDVENGKGEKYRWPSVDVLKSHGAKNPQGRAIKQSQNVSALAISSDGRYLASGGSDRHVHLWDTRTREHIQAFPGHRGPVSCVAFRQGSSELFSGSFDRTVKIWNVEDRAYVNSLFGHQSEILTIDCLRKERVLTAGRDRSMQLFKVPEESRLVFRASASSLECSCFIGNDDFLSGTDDGSVELWSVLRKKPACIVKNAHALSAANKKPEKEKHGKIPNGHIENSNHKAESFDASSVYSWVSSVAVCRSSDLAASGAGNGFVRLWSVGSDSKGIQPLFELPLVGFVNSLALAKSGGFVVAGVGQEPRLGRWGRVSSAQNGVAIHSLKLS